MTNAKEDIRGDIAVMRRAAEKADAEVSQAELEKQRQVSYYWTKKLVTKVMKMSQSSNGIGFNSNKINSIYKGAHHY